MTSSEKELTRTEVARKPQKTTRNAEGEPIERMINLRRKLRVN